MTNEELISRLERRLSTTCVLNLVNAKLNDQNISDVIEWLKGYPKITNLNLSFNDLGWQAFMELLAVPTLEVLRLPYNKIYFPGVNERDQHILKNTGIKQVNIAYNHISAEGKELLKASKIKDIYCDEQLWELTKVKEIG